jgi:hypothetical protein
MMKRIFTVLGLTLLVAFSFGCTSSSDKQDEAVVEGEAATEGDSDFFAEEEEATADETSSELAEGGEAAAGATDDAASDVTSSETGLEEFDEGGDDVLADLGEDPPVVDSTAPEASATDAGTTTDTATDALAEGGVPVDEPVGDLQAGETAGLDYSEGGESVDSTEAPVKVNIPVVKIKDAAYQKGGKNINAVYIAREGDTLSSVAAKVGVADASDFNAINTTLREKLKVGQKVYYQSPQRPDDAARMLTYYEDMGLAPEIYVSQAGDNIRKVSSDLLGHTDSWKEVWATNLDVESKGELSEGVQLKYWKGAGGALPPVAQNSPPPSEEGNSLDGAAPPQATAGNTASAGEEIPPPPSDATLEEDFPPPPSAATIEPPPPPPPPPRVQPKSDDPFAMGDDPNQTMALAVGAILLLAALLLLVVIRKKRARRDVDFSTSTSTQIE